MQAGYTMLCEQAPFEFAEKELLPALRAI